MRSLFRSRVVRMLYNRVISINITDAVVSFEHDVYWTTEDSGSVEICVVTTTTLNYDIVVMYVLLF